MFAPAVMCRLSLPLSIALACVSVAAAAPARADDVEALIKRGVELRRSGQDAEALELFRRAYDAAQTPRALAQMGLAEQALGRWPEAEAHIVKALAADKDAWILKNRSTLDASLVAIGEHLGSLEILGEPAGAEVIVDGQVAGKLPMAQPLRLATGSVAVEVRARGRLSVSRTVLVSAGQLTRETVRLPVA